MDISVWDDEVKKPEVQKPKRTKPKRTSYFRDVRFFIVLHGAIREVRRVDWDKTLIPFVGAVVAFEGVIVSKIIVVLGVAVGDIAVSLAKSCRVSRKRKG